MKISSIFMAFLESMNFNRNTIVPTQIYGPSAVPEKMARFIKSNRYFCKSDQVNSNSKTEKKAAVEKGIMKKLVNE